MLQEGLKWTRRKNRIEMDSKKKYNLHNTKRASNKQTQS